MIFGIKEKSIILTIATNKTGFVVQGHICGFNVKNKL